MDETLQGAAPKGRRKPPWGKPFLKVLADSGNVTRAAASVGIHRMTAYRARMQQPDFSQAWDDALETFVDGIEAEAVRRAVKGVVRYKFYKGKAVLHPDLCRCGHTFGAHEVDAACREEGCSCRQFLAQPYQEREYSDALLALLLKGLRPGTYRDSLGLSQEEIDQYIEKRIAEQAEARVEARLNQLGIRNGTAHPSSSARTADPQPAPQVSPPPDPGPSGPEGPPPAGEFPRRPPWLPPEDLPPRNQASGP
jgi:hypothetical protein